MGYSSPRMTTALANMLLTLVVFSLGIVHATKGTSVKAGLFCSNFVFGSYLGQFCCVDCVCILVGVEIGGAVCSMVLSVRSFQRKVHLDNQLRSGNYTNNEDYSRIEEISTRHFYMGGASVINFVLIILWLYFVIESENDTDNSSEVNALDNLLQQNTNVTEGTESGAVATDDALLEGETTQVETSFLGETSQVEPSAPPFEPIIIENEIPPPRFDELDPPPRYEDIYKVSSKGKNPR